jgi:hypothetical protein
MAAGGHRAPGPATCASLPVSGLQHWAIMQEPKLTGPPPPAPCRRGAGPGPVRPSSCRAPSPGPLRVSGTVTVTVTQCHCHVTGRRSESVGGLGRLSPLLKPRSSRRVRAQVTAASLPQAAQVPDPGSPHPGPAAAPPRFGREYYIRDFPDPDFCRDRSPENMIPEFRVQVP